MRHLFILFVTAMVLGIMILSRTSEGLLTRIHNYPWFAAIPTSTGTPRVCAGALIHPHVVLTSKFTKTDVGMPVVLAPTSNIMLDPLLQEMSRVCDRTKVFQSSDAVKTMARYGEVRYVSNTIIPNPHADLMLLFLDYPSTQTPLALTTTRPKDGDNLKIIGYRRTEPLFNTKALFHYAPDLEPVWLSHVEKKKYKLDGYICARSWDATECSGDSGGALLTEDNLLAGVIVGRATVGCPIENNTLNLFTDISQYRDSIVTTINSIVKYIKMK